MPHAFVPIDPRAKQKFERATVCDRCYRSRASCICAAVTPIDTRLRVVILQHPQEQFKVLNSARLTHLLLPKSAILTGLSWRNFKKVAGPDEIPSLWGVLYLSPGALPTGEPLTVIDRRKQPVNDVSFLRGIVAIDGTWKQAKALWWRNPWLTRLNRISLNPATASLRPQVKDEGLSTIEAVAFSLEHLGEAREVGETLRSRYKELIINKSGQE